MKLDKEQTTRLFAPPADEKEPPIFDRGYAVRILRAKAARGTVTLTPRFVRFIADLLELDEESKGPK